MSGSQEARKKLARDKILVALDVTSIEKALELVHLLKDYVGGFKVGLELCTNCGTPQVVEKISQAGGQVFLDLKFKDIPNTVAGASRAAARDGILMFNVHCDGGSEMMRASVAAVSRQSTHRPLVIGVTVLTSIDQRIMNEEVGVQGDVGAHAVHLAQLAKSAGLDGVVCSPREVALIKSACGRDFLTVVPGVRPTWAETGDQKRVMTPSEAVAAGADYLVIGRPITSPPQEIGSPVEAAKRIAAELN